MKCAYDELIIDRRLSVSYPRCLGIDDGMAFSIPFDLLSRCWTRDKSPIRLIPSNLATYKIPRNFFP